MRFLYMLGKALQNLGLAENRVEAFLREEAKAASGPEKHVWLDVGAHLGETSFQIAKAHPDLVVYAFEPNLKIAAKRFGILRNYVLIPMAVANSDTFCPFYLNRYDQSSSLLPFDEQGLKNWVGGRMLEIEKEVIVPTVRLDTFLNRMRITKVDVLKSDAQGADFDVVLSAGDRLRDIEKIVLETTITSVQLYSGAKEKSVVVGFLDRNGFDLVAAIPQVDGQAEDLIFVRKRE